MGGLEHAFPGTRCSVVYSVRSIDPRERHAAFDTLVAGYWKPVYKYIRCKWPCDNEDAKDLTQGFFARALEKDYFDTYDATKAKFRTFLRTCVDRYVANEIKMAGRVKRGGDRLILSLDFNSAEEETRRIEPAARADPNRLFDEEWVRSLFTLAVDELRRQCAESGKQVQFALFERYDLREPDDERATTYEQLAQEFGLTTIQITNYLSSVRGRFRKLVVEKIRATTGSEEEFVSEMNRILGGKPR